MNLKRNLSTLLALTLIVLILMPTKSSSAANDLPYLELNRPDRGKVFAIAWSPDGQYIAVGTEQGLWIYTDTFTDVTHADDKPIHALAWSPDGKTIAAGYFGIRSEQAQPEDRLTYLIEGGGLQLWSVSRASDVITLTAGTTLLQDGSVYSLRYNADGSKLAMLAEYAQLISEDTFAQDRLQIYASGTNKLIYDAFAGRNDSLHDNRVTHGANGLDWLGNQLTVIRGTSGEVKHNFPILDVVGDSVKPQTSYVDRPYFWATLTAAGWNEDGTQLAVSAITSDNPNTSGGIVLCDRDATNGDLCGSLPTIKHGIEHPGSVPTLAWRPHAPLLAYTEGTVIHLWDNAAQKLSADLDAAYADVTMLAWKPDGSALLSAGSDSVVRLWTQFAPYQTPSPQPYKIVTLPLVPYWDTPSPDGRWLAEVERSDDITRGINLIDTKDNSKRTILSLPNATQSDYLDVRWSPDSKILVSWHSSSDSGCSGLGEYAVQLWSAETGALLVDLGQIVDLSWRPDGKAIAAGKSVGFRSIFIEVREVPSGKLLQTSPSSADWDSRFMANTFDNSFSVDVWSPDGRLLAVGASVGCGDYAPAYVRLWDTKTNNIVGELPTERSSWGGSGNSAHAGAWSPDGKYIAVHGFSDFYLYHIELVGDRLFREVIWQPTETWLYNRVQIFSPDSHYFIFNDLVVDTHTGVVVFKFRNAHYYDYYRWEGDTLIGVTKSDETIHGTEAYFHTSDFLPRQ